MDDVTDSNLTCNGVTPDMVPRERSALLTFCNMQFAHQWNEIQERKLNIGGMVLRQEDTQQEVRRLWRDQFVRDRWNQLSDIVQLADYEETAYKVVLDFIASDWDELASEFVTSKMPFEIDVPIMGPDPEPFNTTERDRLIAKLTEGTVKIACERASVIPHATQRLVFPIIAPIRICRLAFAADCARSLTINDVRSGYRIIQGEVSAEAFTDPGALFVDAGVGYPGMNVTVDVTNNTLVELHVDAWISGLPIDTNCEMPPAQYGTRGIFGYARR